MCTISFQAFAIFCGMGIQNTQMYEKAMKAIAKTRVTIDVLSYHATAPLEEAIQLSVIIFFNVLLLLVSKY